jgi:hypothetical protein
LAEFHAIQQRHPGFFDETNVARGNFWFWSGTAALAALVALLQRFSVEMGKARELRIRSGMRAYSLDLRERIVRAVDSGQSQRAAARRLGVGVSSVKR